MNAQAGPGYAPEQEVRFAVVLYGGVSLAIYINGVAQELLRMVRGTADLPAGEPLTGTERIYRELGQLLGRGSRTPPPTDGAAPDARPVRTRFVVDIISGSSAGGINGVALAKALAQKGRDLDTLKQVWLDEAQIGRLLADAGSDPGRYPPHPDGRATSLLNGERMYGMILSTLGRMNDAGTRTPDAGPFADKLDLFVTATDLAGLSAPIQLSDQTIDERIHKTVFHFEYAPPAGPGSPDRAIDELDARHDAMLAFAARCTSSFPVAFEPMRFDRIAYQLKAQQPGFGLDEAAGRYAAFFPAHQAQGEPFLERGFADGGYLDNRPFSHAIDLIPYRSSTRPASRKLLFIDPFPEIHDGARPAADREVGFIENALLAAMTLPRYEVIRDDIGRLNAYNRRLDRLDALQRRSKRDRERIPQLGEAMRRSPQGFAGIDLAGMVVEHGYGEFYPLYHHLRVYDVTDMLARMVTRLAGFETESDEYYYLRLLVRAWREAHYAPYAEPGRETENAFFDRFDTDYRLRRLNHLRSMIDRMLGTEAEPGLQAQLAPIRAAVEVQIGRLRETTRLLESRSRSPLRGDAAVEALRARLPDRFAGVMNRPDRDGRFLEAVRTYEDPAIGPHVDAVLAEIARHLAQLFDDNRARMWSVMPDDADDATGPELRAIRQAYDCFHWHDALSLPFLDGTGAREHSEVEVYRVSPADSGLVPAYVREGREKLVGTAFGAFGGFFRREWREHDMMWGRLDGAERIIGAILPDPADAALRKSFVDRAHDLILAEEFSTVAGGGDRIFHWLAHKLRDENVTDLSAEDLIRHGDALLARFPSLAQIVAQKDYRTFLLGYYRPPAPPPAEEVADWSSRSLKILGRMIDDLPEGRLTGLRRRAAAACRAAGGLLTALLRFAVPRSLGRKVLDHWLILIGLAGLLMVLVGPLMGAEGVALVGYGTVLGCLLTWMVGRSFGHLLRGRTRWSEPLLLVAGLLVAGLIGLGAVKAWEILRWLSG